MRPLRFCFITTFYPPYHFGGDAIFVYRLAEALAERGHNVHVIHSVDAYRLRQEGDPQIAFTHHPNVTLFPLATTLPTVSTLAVYELGRPAAYANVLNAHFSEYSYDVIHYHNVSLMGAPALLRLGSAVKLYTAHEYWLVCPTHVLFKYDREACVVKDCLQCTIRSGRPPQAWRYTQLLGECLAELDMLFVPSQFSLQRHWDDGVHVAMTVLPHSVPVPATLNSTAPHSAHSGEQQRPYFLFVGRLEKLKGVQDLLEVFARFPNADLRVVGTGAFEQELKERARDLMHVHFLGAQHPDTLRLLYQNAVAVLVPSLCYETFALTAAESMAVATPVIGRRIGAVRELIESSGGGVTFETLAELRDAMSSMLSNSALRNEYGLRGREFALSNWTMDVHLARYFSVIKEKLAAHQSRMDSLNGE